jgi:N6-L-threonylcarbamoyladenine synthase
MIILGIETSCDETSAAVITDNLKVLSNQVYQQKVHGRFGGVVPEIASREHCLKIEVAVEAALTDAGVTKGEIGLVAATHSPGLIGALLVGLSFAKGFAFSQNIPFVGVNHLDAHIKANFLFHGEIEPPFVALVVSGGHTFLVYAALNGQYRLLGNTLDDAAGEALDKGGKMMGLSYPAGKEIEQLAASGDPAHTHFPRALPGKDNLNFSFSGLKTALRNLLSTMDAGTPVKHRADILAAFQEAVIDVLSQKSIMALKKMRCGKLLIAGGVACNKRLREKLLLLMPPSNELYFPPSEYCTDNGAMIGAAGLLKYGKRGPDSFDLTASAVFNIKEVNYGV